MYMDGFTPDAFKRTGMGVTRTARGRKDYKVPLHISIGHQKRRKRRSDIGKKRCRGRKAGGRGSKCAGARFSAMSKMSNKRKRMM